MGNVKPKNALVTTLQLTKSDSFHCASEVQKCKPGRRCASFACFTCATDHQNHFVHGVRHFLDDLAKEAVTDWSFVTIVPDPDQLKNTASLGADISYAKRFIEARLNRAGVNTFVGGLDFSYNIDGRQEKRRFTPHWSIHVHGLIPAKELTPSVAKKLRELFTGSSAVPRPVNIKPFDGADQAIAYCMKPNFWLRTTKLRISRGQDGKLRLSRKPKDSSLPAEQQAELQRALRSLTLSDRMILIGVDVIGDPTTGPLRLRSIASTLNQARTPERRKRLILSNRLSSRNRRILSPESAHLQSIEGALIKLRDAVNNRELFPLIQRGTRLSREQTRRALGFRRCDEIGTFIAIRRKILASIIGQDITHEVVKRLETKNALILDGERNTPKLQALGFLDDRRHRCYRLREAAL